MLQNNEYGGEGSEEERYYECVECDEAIFNPLCPDCLSIEIEAWLTNYPDLKKKLIPKMKDYVRYLSRIKRDSTMCVHCYKKTASLCPYCFTKFVFDELQELSVSKQIIKEFFRFFNFDFEHTGYSKEAENLGVA